ncbi:hypothetical protein GCM10027280_54840 [Micromonospora polyrhachis]|uniref:Uncharacterized protein n=1 Tax=Micromonospora polyrhachis TaxID=1282883 RepID=A0A7W7SSD6_9ACTN|nr:hypothetical protein [Micromonospora polyrhachis]MBB4959696.1 hypothetical protein [Micromonospora polyrhachis]
MTTPTMTAQYAVDGRPPSSLLRTVLLIDAWSTLVFGVFLLAGGSWLGGPLGLPITWSVPIGVAMLGGAAALGLIAGYPRIPARLALTVVAGNLLGGVALVLLTVSDLLPLTGFGTVFVLFGAVLVVVGAALEFIGYRRYQADGR